MKKFFLSVFAFSALLLTSCDEDEPIDPIVPPVVIDTVQSAEGTGIIAPTGDGTATITGTFIGDSNISLSSDVIYTLSGRVIIGDRSVLNIEAGTIIKGSAGTGSLASSLIIARNADINAVGTAASPIIMTSVEDNIAIGEVESALEFSTNARGLWGGLVILGNAPISAGGNAIAGSDGAEAQVEGIPDNIEEGRYGGSVSADNSGTLSYVSVRFAGTDIATDNELNGITLGGVGSATTINNIEIYAGFDDAIEFFGGSVNVTNLIINGQGDDGVDADQGYSGTVDNVLVISNQSNSGFELDGPEAEFLGDSFFTIKNATLMGPSNARIAELKSGVAVKISNVLAMDYTTEEIQINGGSAFGNFTSGATELTNWEIIDSRAASAIVTTDQEGTPSSDFLSVVTTATVGANTSVFDSWTNSSAKGDY